MIYNNKTITDVIKQVSKYQHNLNWFTKEWLVSIGATRWNRFEYTGQIFMGLVKCLKVCVCTIKYGYALLRLLWFSQRGSDRFLQIFSWLFIKHKPSCMFLHFSIILDSFKITILWKFKILKFFHFSIILDRFKITILWKWKILNTPNS